MTSAYVEFNVEDFSLKNLHKNDCCWSNDSEAFVAVSVYSNEAGGSVRLLNENSLLVESNSDMASQVPSKPGIKVISFSWHPAVNVLAVAWENGDLGCFFVSKQRTRWVYASSLDDELAVQAPISHLHWGGLQGRELFTVDAAGLVVIWTFDSVSSLLSVRATHQLTDEISDTALALTDDDAGLFLASISGMVYHLQSSSVAVTDVIQLEHPIRRLLYFGRRSRLIVITEALVLYQYSIAGDEVTETVKVKLSGLSRPLGSTEPVLLNMIDDHMGMISICIIGERIIRL